MKLLLDSNVLLWALFAPYKLTTDVASIISDERNVLLVSFVSLWELSIKIALGKLSYVESIDPLFVRTRELNPTMLPLTMEHIRRVASLPHHHRDPFDRMLIVQALTESVPLLTSDSRLKAYDVQIILN